MMKRDVEGAKTMEILSWGSPVFPHLRIRRCEMVYHLNWIESIYFKRVTADNILTAILSFQKCRIVD
jgi:hypothetical protein